MTYIPTQNGSISVRTQDDGRHLVTVRPTTAGVEPARAVLTDEQLAMLGRVCVGRGVPTVTKKPSQR